MVVRLSDWFLRKMEATKFVDDTQESHQGHLETHPHQNQTWSLAKLWQSFAPHLNGAITVLLLINWIGCDGMCSGGTVYMSGHLRWRSFYLLWAPTIGWQCRRASGTSLSSQDIPKNVLYSLNSINIGTDRTWTFCQESAPLVARSTIYFRIRLEICRKWFQGKGNMKRRGLTSAIHWVHFRYPLRGTFACFQYSHAPSINHMIHTWFVKRRRELTYPTYSSPTIFVNPSNDLENIWQGSATTWKDFG